MPGGSARAGRDLLDQLRPRPTLLNRLAKTPSGGMARKLERRDLVWCTGLACSSWMEADLRIERPKARQREMRRGDRPALRRTGRSPVQLTALLHSTGSRTIWPTASAVVDHGSIVVEGLPEQLKSDLNGDTVDELLSAESRRQLNCGLLRAAARAT